MNATHADFCAQFVPKGGRVLDVGSGRGTFLCAMAKRGFESFGVEVAPSYVEESLSRAAKEGVVIRVVRSPAERLPFPDDHFAFVNCAEVSEHVEDPAAMCREIFRVLAKGGRCYISFHNRFGLYDYHYHLYLVNWLPRILAEAIIKLLGREKEDSVIGRQRLMTMHYVTYARAVRALRATGFGVHDVRYEKIRKRFGYLALPALTAYVLIFRPLYFNTFHFLVEKP